MRNKLLMSAYIPLKVIRTTQGSFFKKLSLKLFYCVITKNSCVLGETLAYSG